MEEGLWHNDNNKFAIDKVSGTVDIIKRLGERGESGVPRWAGFMKQRCKRRRKAIVDEGEVGFECAKRSRHRTSIG